MEIVIGVSCLCVCVCVFVCRETGRQSVFKMVFLASIECWQSFAGVSSSKR